jgi:hypothetical protein
VFYFILRRYLKVKLKDDDAVSIHPNAMAATANTNEDEELDPMYKGGHVKLADYFEQSENYDRKVEVGPQ